jgi:hypothetical protein
MRQNSVITYSQKFTNRWLHEVLPDGSWSGGPCFIVGGGPSLEGFDWDLLKSKRTIGINRAYEVFDPTMIFSMDTSYLNRIYRGEYGQDALERFKASRSLKVWLIRADSPISLPDGILLVKHWMNYKESLRAFSPSLCEGIGHGNNSGYAALNLACCLGANPVYLLGFDMRHKPNCHYCGKPFNGRPPADPDHPDFCNDLCFRAWAAKVKPMPGVEDLHITHWHSGHPCNDSSVTVEAFAHFFERAAPAIRSRGIEVINLNPDSMLQCFPKRPWQEVLN